MSKTIDHIGIIERIEGDTLFVRIEQESACSECHAKGLCTTSERKEKIIEVMTDNFNAYHVNEKVIVSAELSLGLKAVLLAFVFPLIIVVMAIIIGTYLNWDESTNGTIGLALLIPYYVILYYFRNRIKKKFVFTLKKLI
ncbi:SoxR reducing system RseC family protein [Parabacteroides pacaensis]|uniref:SoxR reducing system RseC family protein n=1 Tax=Parabacteroides pacaensis TaxID=2086575 RepID=UPI000D110D76|nr:SoxR reducing system RseC family protein [Parabacteroides pacaensis]